MNRRPKGISGQFAKKRRQKNWAGIPNAWIERLATVERRDKFEKFTADPDYAGYYSVVLNHAAKLSCENGRPYFVACEEGIGFRAYTSPPIGKSFDGSYTVVAFKGNTVWFEQFAPWIRQNILTLRSRIRELNRAGARLQLRKNKRFGMRNATGEIDADPFLLTGKDNRGRNLKIKGSDTFIEKTINESTK